MPTSRQAIDIFVRYASTLLRTIEGSYILCWDLFHKKVISADTLSTVTTPGREMFSANNELLKGVLRAIEADGDSLKVVISILEQHTSVCKIAEKMKKDLQELGESLGGGAVSSPSSEQKSNEEESAVTSQAQGTTSVLASAASIATCSLKQDPTSTEMIIKFDTKVVKKFKEVFGILGGLVQVVMTSVIHEGVHLNDLKYFLVFVYPHLKEELEAAGNVYDVFLTVMKECTLFNYCILTDIANRFKLQSVFDQIHTYAQREEEYRHRLLDEEFFKELKKVSIHFGTDPSQKVPVKLKVNWPHDEATIEKFQDLVIVELEEVARYLHLVVADKGCFVFTCYCPLQLEGVVTRLVQEREKSLRRNGVILVMVGESIVIDTVSDEEQESLLLGIVSEEDSKSVVGTKGSNDPKMFGEEIILRELLAEERQRYFKLQEEMNILRQQKQEFEATVKQLQESEATVKRLQDKLNETQAKLEMENRVSRNKTRELEQIQANVAKLQEELKTTERSANEVDFQQQLDRERQTCLEYMQKVEGLEEQKKELKQRIAQQRKELDDNYRQLLEATRQEVKWHDDVREKEQECEGHKREIEFLKQQMKDQGEDLLTQISQLKEETTKRQMDIMRAKALSEKQASTLSALLGRKKDIQEHYVLNIYSKQMFLMNWEVVFTAAPDRPPWTQLVEEEYVEWTLHHRAEIEFEEKEVEADDDQASIFFERETAHGWNTHPITAQQILKKHIDGCIKEMRTTLPVCKLAVTCEDELEKAPVFECHVNLVGAKVPNKFFTLRIFPVPLPSVVSASTTGAAVSIPITPGLMSTLDTLPEGFLDPDHPEHLPTVLVYLHEKGIFSQWKIIGVLLQLPYSDMEKIERDHPEVNNCVMAMVHQWLMSGTATKQALVDALRWIR